jgi:folate-binding protein YgfZ
MTSLALHEWHESHRAAFREEAGMEVVSHYGSIRGEYDALTTAAGLVDLSFRGRICIAGSDQIRFLHGQVTNDVKKLGVGQGCYAALITAKGKMQSDLNIYRLADELLLDFEPGLTAAIQPRFEKYVIADDVRMVDVSADYGLLSVQGPKASETLVAAGLVKALPPNPMDSILTRLGDVGEIYVVRHERFNAGGFDLFIPAGMMKAAAEKLIAAVEGNGGMLCGWDALELARFEAGIARFGLDMDETNLPLEAGLEKRAVSFSKGCYIGQEVISRIKTYGQVTKSLRLLVFQEEPVVPIQRGEKLFHQDKEIGYITSGNFSPRRNETLAMGYVRKEANQAGQILYRSREMGGNAVEVVAW